MGPSRTAIKAAFVAALLLPLAIALADPTASDPTSGEKPRPPPPVSALVGAKPAVPLASGSVGDLNADERQVARLLLDGAFGSEDQKVTAIDQATAFIRSLTPGRKLDLLNNLFVRGKDSKKAKGKSHLMDDPQFARIFREAIGYSLVDAVEEGLSEDDKTALSGVAELLARARANGAEPENTALLRRKLAELRARATRTLDASKSMHQTLMKIRETVGKDAQLSTIAKKEFNAALDSVGLGSMRDLKGSSDDFAGVANLVGERFSMAMKPALRKEFAERAARLKSAVQRDGSNADKVITEWNRFVTDLSTLARQPGEDGKKFAEALRKATLIDWASYDLKALGSLETLRQHAAAEGLRQIRDSRQVAHLDRAIAVAQGDASAFQGFFSDVADMRAFVFKDPSIKPVYRATVTKALDQLIQYDPGEDSDAILARFKNLAEAVKGSELPDAVRGKLNSGLRSLADRVDTRLGEFQNFFHELSQLPSKITVEDVIAYSKLPVGAEIEKDVNRRLLALAMDIHDLPGGQELVKRLKTIAGSVRDLSTNAPGSSGTLTEIAAFRGFMNEHLDLFGESADDIDRLMKGLMNIQSNQVEQKVRERLLSLRQRVAELPILEEEKKELLRDADRFDSALISNARDLDTSIDYARNLRSNLRTDPTAEKLLGEDGVRAMDALADYDWNSLGLRAVGRSRQLTSKVTVPELSRETKVEIMDRLQPALGWAVSQIDVAADQMINSGEIKFPAKEYEALFKVLVGGYFRRMSPKYKQLILANLLKLPPNATLLDQMRVILQGTGPQFQKLVQLFSDEPGIPKGFKDIAESLQDDIPAASMEEVHEALLKRIPELYPSRFKSFDPVGRAGSMAQGHLAEFDMGNGETQFVWVRLIKPGMEERVEEDLKIFKEIVPEIEAHPDVKDTFIEKIGNSVNALGRGVQIEADTGITANNQAEGVRAYSGKKNWALPGGKKIGVEVVVPEILNQSSADSGVHIQSVARGIKLGTLLGNDPLTYRAITKNLARMWLHEALFGSGFFHTDLHPGNIMASRDRSGNVSLTILDFGMADRLDPKLRGEFMKMTVAVDHKDVNGILDSLRSLLQEPIPDGKLREVVKQALAEDPSNYNVMKAVFKQGGTFADSFTNFTRGLWFVQQMLSKSGSPHKVEELIGKEAVKQLLAEVPKRAGQVVTLDLDSRPEAGVPLTNREVGKAANLYIRRCIKRSLESLKSTGRE